MHRKVLVLIISLVFATGFFTFTAVERVHAQDGEEAPEEEIAPGADVFEEEGSFDQWDENNDSELSELEFRQGFENAGWFDNWDTDNDGNLGNDELAQSYETWKGDQDILGIETFGEQYWDVNEDGQVSREEFVQMTMERWDVNGDESIDIGEYEAGLFRTLDADGNELIYESEWTLLSAAGEPAARDQEQATAAEAEEEEVDVEGAIETVDEPEDAQDMAEEQAGVTPPEAEGDEEAKLETAEPAIEEDEVDMETAGEAPGTEAEADMETAEADMEAPEAEADMEVAQAEEEEEYGGPEHAATEEHQEFEGKTAPGADVFTDRRLPFEQYFRDWDRNTNDELDEQEFRTGFEDTGWYQAWDQNGDGMLDDNEIAMSYETWSGAEDILGVQAFAEPYWDIDENNQVGKHEFVHVVMDRWDTNNDGSIDMNEYERGMFEAMDADDNDALF
jgi:Ca2+-binding EF-hand superfamily protein